VVARVTEKEEKEGGKLTATTKHIRKEVREMEEVDLER